ncbi:MAG: nucleotidyltransferase family protein, partial [Euryarchaeota archaeon]
MNSQTNTGRFTMFRKFTPEEELLLCCARTRLEPPTAARVCELLEGGVDWNRLIILARQHFVTQLFYWHLRERVQNVAPAAFTQELQRDFRANVDRNLYLASELLRLLPLFETVGIPVIVFKGPVFAVNVYKNIALRTFGDLDILLRKHDLA